MRCSLSQIGLIKCVNDFLILRTPIFDCDVARKCFPDVEKFLFMLKVVLFLSILTEMFSIGKKET